MNRDQDPSYFKTFAINVSQPIYTEFTNHLYDEAGVSDYDGYFDLTTTKVSRGDPAGEVTHRFATVLVDEFATLYDHADFEAAERVEPDDFRRLPLATAPGTVANLRELFHSAGIIQDTGSRVIQTAILEAALENLDLPALPDEAIRTDTSQD